jgi:ethanolamine utilization microcompartment shell protein EutS
MSIKKAEVFTLGADPEFFLYDTKAKHYIGAHEYLMGSKDKPYELSEGAVQIDGMAAEFNIKPCDNADDFNRRVKRTLSDIRDFVPGHVEFRFNPIVSFPDDYFDSVGDDLKTLGCDPDYDAYSLAPNPTPVIPGSLRTGSGHLHFGFLDPDTTRDVVSTKEYMEFMCHLIVGSHVASNVLNRLGNRWAPEEERRRWYYGQVGAFRPKTYGFELRSPSNKWLDSPCYKHVFTAAKDQYERF